LRPSERTFEPPQQQIVYDIERKDPQPQAAKPAVPDGLSKDVSRVVG
jgi:hypothetical protein